MLMTGFKAGHGRLVEGVYRIQGEKKGAHVFVFV